MMDLETQIITLAFSLIFGFLTAILLSFLYKLIYHKKTKYQIISSFSLVMILSVIYFFIMQRLNNAILHPYYILMFILGFMLEIVSVKWLKKIEIFKKK